MPDLNPAVVEAAAKALFEDPLAVGELTWADVANDDPTRAELWRDDARRILLAAAAATAEPDYLWGVRHVDYPDIVAPVDDERAAWHVADFAGRWLPVRREVGPWTQVRSRAENHCEHDWPMKITSGDACKLGCGARRA